MATPASKAPLTHLRTSDIRGIAKLATQATAGVTRIAEGLHDQVGQSLALARMQLIEIMETKSALEKK